MNDNSVTYGDIKNVLLEVIDFLDLKYKGLAIFNEKNGSVLKANQRFIEIFDLKTLPKRKNEFDELVEKYDLKYASGFFYKTPDGNRIDYKVKKITGADNEEILSIWTFEELTYDKTRMQLLETIVEFSKDGIHAVDHEGKMIVYNKAQGKIDHYAPETIIGKKLTDIYALDWDTSLLLKVLKTQKPFENVRQGYYTKAGVFVDCVTSILPLFYNNTLFGSVAVVRDYNGILQTIDEERKQLKNEKIKNMATQPEYKLKQTRYTFNDIITADLELIKNIQVAKQAAKTDSNILIIGETGTGKEMFAQSIHNYSMRRDGPFLAINCAAIPESLLEGLLFGTTKGAFTGATDKAGLFEEADGGTVFLDEINSMSMFLQSKLLRVLEERTVTRLGSNKIIRVNARIISSCNENPMQAIQENNFRSDLFYRLAVVYIVIPCLRKRKDDIEVLTKYFIELYNKQFDKQVIDISAEVRTFFKTYSWPGNVRQFRHLLESAINIIDRETHYISMEYLPEYILKEGLDHATDISQDVVSKDEKNIFDELKEKERETIIECLKKHNGNISKTASYLGMSRQKLYYRLKKYRLK